MALEDYVLPVAAGTLGFITDNIPGAVAGYSIAKGYLKRKKESSKNLPNKKQNTNKMPPIPRVAVVPATKRKMYLLSKTKGRRSGKVKKGRKVKKGSRSFCKKVIACVDDANNRDAPVGFYEVTRGTQIQMGDIAYKLALATSCNDGYEMVLSSPQQLLDAASVLFNGKTVAVNWGVATNNFNFNTNVYIEKNWTTFMLKNNSSRTMIIDMWTLESKVSDTDTLDTNLNAALASIACSYRQPSPAGTSLSNFQSQYGFDIKKLPLTSTKYNVKSKSFVMLPGATRTINVICRTGDFNFKKYRVTDTTLSYTAAGWTKNIIFKGRDYPQLNANGPLSVQNVSGYGVSVYVTHKYKMRAPDSTPIATRRSAYVLANFLSDTVSLPNNIVKQNPITGATNN